MKRKLVQMGKGCLMSAIPKKWLDQNNLKKGDTIEFEPSENYLLITSKPKIITKETSIQLKGLSKIAIYRILSMLYDSGFTKINIEYDNAETLTHILWSINVLEDWKIEPTGKNKCIINSIVKENEEIKVLFRRVMLLTKEFVNDVTEYIISKDNTTKSNERENLKAKHTIILSQLQTIKRLINTSILPLEYKHYYFIAIQLEEIIDHYEYFLRAIENTKKISSEIISIQKKLSKLYNDAYAQVYSFDMDWFIKFHEEITIWKWFEKIEHSELTYHLRAISERIRNILKHSAGIQIK